jgi:hypothetical protein
VNVDPLKVRQNDDMYDDDEHGMCEKDLHTIIMMRKKKKKREKSFVIFCVVIYHRSCKVKIWFKLNE